MTCMLKPKRNWKTTAVHSHPKSLFLFTCGSRSAVARTETSSLQLSKSRSSKFLPQQGTYFRGISYLLALESQLFDECMIGVEIDWNNARGRQCSNTKWYLFWERTRLHISLWRWQIYQLKPSSELEVYAEIIYKEDLPQANCLYGKINPAYMPIAARIRRAGH